MAEEKSVGTTTARVNMSRVHEHMDGLRGALVFIVMATHVFYLSTLTREPMPWYNEMALWFQPSMGAVAQFIVISGYCLMLPVAHSDKRTLSGGVAGYLKRRMRRILPPYYAASAISLAHLYFFAPLYRRVGQALDPWHAGILWSHLLLFYNFSFYWRYAINGAYWSLAPEWQLYLLFPIALVPFWRRFGSRASVAAASVAVVLGLLLLGGKVGDMHPWYLLLFVLGMAGAVATSSTDPAFAARRDRVPWVRIAQGLMGLFVCEWVGVALFWPAVFAHRRLPWQQYSFIETVSGLVLLCGFMHWHRVQRVLPVARWPLVLRMLHQRQIMGLGRFSYSLYLVHLPVLATVIGLVRSLGLGEAPTLLLAYCTALPLAIGAGYLFFLAVERRCLPTYAKQPEPVAARVLASEQSA